MKIITITNQKGGAGKTTTVDATLSGLKNKGFNVLAIDLDPQCNLTFSLNADLSLPNILDVMTGEADIGEAIQKSPRGDFIAGSKQMSRAEMIFTDTGKEYCLKEALSNLKTKYDYVLIDTPPALGILTINALTACNSVVIPAQADIYSIQGIERLFDTINAVKQYTNNKIKVAGILLTRYSDRAVLSKTMADMAAQISTKMKSKVFTASIREAIAIKEAQLSQQSIFDYAKNSKVSDDYSEFVDELIAETK